MLKKTVIFIVIIVCILSFFILSVGYFENNNNVEKNNKIKYFERLSININTSNDSNYYFLIPMIVNKDGQYLSFQNDLSDELKNSSINVELGNYGYMLNISGKGNSTIYAIREIDEMYEEYFDYSITMLNNSNTLNGFFNFNYYYNSSINNPIILNYKFIAKSRLSGRSIQFTIENPKSGIWSTDKGFGGGSSIDF